LNKKAEMREERRKGRRKKEEKRKEKTHSCPKCCIFAFNSFVSLIYFYSAVLSSPISAATSELI